MRQEQEAGEGRKEGNCHFPFHIYHIQATSFAIDLCHHRGPASDK